MGLFRIILLPLLLLLAGRAGAQGSHIAKSSVIGSALPAFTIRLTDGSVFSSSSLPANVPVMIAYIDPTCGHCITEALHIRMAMDSSKLGNLQVVLVAATAEGMAGILPMLQLEKHPALHIGVDDSYKLYDYYGVQQVPFNAWYNAKGELVKTGVQDFKINELVAWMATQ